MAEEAKEIITEKKDEEKTDELAKVDDVKVYFELRGFILYKVMFPELHSVSFES